MICSLSTSWPSWGHMRSRGCRIPSWHSVLLWDRQGSQGNFPTWTESYHHVHQRLPCLVGFTHTARGMWFILRKWFFSQEFPTITGEIDVYYTYFVISSTVGKILSPVPVLAGGGVHRYRFYPVKWYLHLRLMYSTVTCNDEDHSVCVWHCVCVREGGGMISTYRR